MGNQAIFDTSSDTEALVHTDFLLFNDDVQRVKMLLLTLWVIQFRQTVNCTDVARWVSWVTLALNTYR